MKVIKTAPSTIKAPTQGVASNPKEFTTIPPIKAPKAMPKLKAAILIAEATSTADGTYLLAS